MTDTDLKRNTSGFSMTETVADIATNPAFSKGYRDLVAGRQNDQTLVWEALSSMGEELADTIYENVLNYIDNVANIDTCKVKALFSMCEVMGVANNGLLTMIDHMPDEVLRLLDLFSINQSYATKWNVNSQQLTGKLKDLALQDSEFSALVANTSAMAVGNEGTPGVVSSKTLLSSMSFGYNVPANVYQRFLSAAFLDCLSSNLYNKYDGTSLSPSETNGIYDGHISSGISSLPIAFVISANLEYEDTYVNKSYIGGIRLHDISGFHERSRLESTAEYVKRHNGIEDFDQHKAADDIDNGLSLLEDFTGARRQVVDLIRESRAMPHDHNDRCTRYAYYHELKAVEYLKFIDRFFNATDKERLSNLINSVSIYDVDTSYIKITSAYLSARQSSILGDAGTRINFGCVSAVAAVLADVCMAVSDIREHLKTQAQRNHMRGTKLLLSYVVSEYLKKCIPATYGAAVTQNISGMTRDKVQVVEYWDMTEYYNLSTDTSEAALNGNQVNAKFWESEIADVTGVGLADEDISKFYLSTLNLHTVVDDERDFLNIIYELGADRGYVDKRTGNLVEGLLADDIYSQIESKFETLSNDYYALSNYQREILLTYGGMQFSYDPYYNWKNTAHPSYQTHPYLKKFLEYTQADYAIKSAFGGNANELVLQALRTKAISAILAETGRIRNIWDRQAMDSVGWQTRYERSSHNQSTNFDAVSPIQHYDGVFYPSAVEDYVKFMQDASEVNPVTGKSPEYISAFQMDCMRGSITRQMLIDAVSSYIYAEPGTDWDLGPVEPDRVFADGKHDREAIGAELRAGQFRDWLSGHIGCISSMHDNLILQAAENLDEAVRAESERAYRNAVVSAGTLPRTFFEKWYSHLRLPAEDLSCIAVKLVYFYPDILDLYNDVDGGSDDGKVWDIYKYGLDRYTHSILLYKRCRPDATYKERQDTPGEIWVRFNSHPIGFPAFVGKSTGAASSVYQVDPFDVNIRLSGLIDNYQGRRLRIFHDFDITDDYRNVVLAYSLNPGTKYRELSDFLLVKPSEDITYRNDAFERLIKYRWLAMGEGTRRTDYIDRDTAVAGVRRNPIENPGTLDFQGFYQHTTAQQVWLFWTRYVPGAAGGQGVIDVVRFSVPDCTSKGRSIYAGNRADQANSRGLDGLDLSPQTMVCQNISGDYSDVVKVGYASGLKGDGIITLATLVDLEPEFVGINYSGLNTRFLKGSTDISAQYAAMPYGVMDYRHNPKSGFKDGATREDDVTQTDLYKECEDEDNSFDRLSQHVALMTFNNSDMWRSPTRSSISSKVKLYNLNSDASFIPLYCAYQGFMRMWAVDYYSHDEITSMEVLGYSFRELSAKYDTFYRTLYTDEDGNLTSIDPAGMLSSAFRVYEQYGMKVEKNVLPDGTIQWNASKTEDEHFAALYNDVLLDSDGKFTWKVELDNLLLDTEEHRGKFKVLLYATARGASNPILACGLNDLLGGSSTRYVNAPTEADSVYLYNRYIAPFVTGFTGTQDVLAESFNPAAATGSTNYIMGIGTANAVYDGARTLTMTFTKHGETNPNPDFVNVSEMLIDRYSLALFVYDESLKEFEDYHFMYAHSNWPFLSVSNNVQIPDPVPEEHEPRDFIDLYSASTLSAIDLGKYHGSFADFDRITTEDTNPLNKEYLSVVTGGSYSFKISEQMEPYFKFPPSKLDDSLQNIFSCINKRFTDLSSVLKTPNTYVFELQRPKEMADVLKDLAVTIYAEDEDFILAYDEYISCMYHVSKYKEEFLGYEMMWEEGVPSNANVQVSSLVESEEAYDAEVYVASDSFKSKYKFNYGLMDTEIGVVDIPVGEIRHTSTEEEVKDLFRIYVNWAKDEKLGPILYFNYNNFFNSPFMYRTKAGNFQTLYRPNTWLSLAPGQTGDLNIVGQIRYYNYLGTTLGVKDIPLINYTIENISDDKPKFSVLPCWITSTRLIQPSIDPPVPPVRSAYLRVNWTHVGYNPDDPSDTRYSLSANMYEDYTTSDDLSAIVTVDIDSVDGTPIGNSSVDIVYEYTNRNIELLEQYCIGGVFNFNRAGMVSVRTTSRTFQLGFLVKANSVIDEETGQIVVPIDAINFTARTADHVKIENTKTYMGGIVFDFRISGRLPDRFLGNERETTPDKFNGFQISEERKPIKIFQNKKYSEDA